VLFVVKNSFPPFAVAVLVFGHFAGMLLVSYESQRILIQGGPKTDIFLVCNSCI